VITGGRLDRGNNVVQDGGEWDLEKQPLSERPEQDDDENGCCDTTEASRQPSLAPIEIPPHRKRRSSLFRRYVDSPNNSTTTPVTPPLNLESDFESSEEAVTSTVPGPRWTRFFGGGRWRASNPWRWKIDAPRAILEFVRVGLGYIL
jgi:hypothetical protein